MWKFALVLAVVHGVSCNIPSTYWVLQTLQCSEYRVVVEPDKNLVETPEALDQMCKQQDEFYKCMEIIFRFMGPSRASELTSKIASEISVFYDLCSADSPWRRRYLEFAPCINMQQSDFCRTPEFLGDGTDLSSPLPHVKEKMENCIAATLSMKCGVEAGQLFHYLLKAKIDDVCHPVKMTCTDAHPSSDGNHSTENAFGETYDQLVKKIGYIPEQDSEESFALHERVGHVHEESESVDESEAGSLEIEDSDKYSQFMEFEDSENVEHAVSEDNDSVSEVTTSIDETTEDFPRKPDIFDIFNQFGLTWQDVFNQRKELMATGPHTLPSRMKERMRRSHTFIPEKYETVRIFPDGRINYYSRRRDIKDLETIKCYNFRDYFVCINMPRSKYPRCLDTTVFTGPRQGEFFPEEFDPEFGAQWYETIPKEAYIFEPWSSVAESVLKSYVPLENRRTEDMIKLLDDVGVETLFVSTDHLSLNTNSKHSDAYEFIAREKRAEIVTSLFQYFTAALPSISRVEIKNLVPKNVAKALRNLYESKSFENVKIRLDDLGKIYIFWYNHESVIDAITCGKVNECHPKGEGIWKCVIEPRPPIEIDDLDI